jgi:DNA-binding NtrC family response regulator
MHFPGELHHDLEELIRLRQLVGMGPANPDDRELMNLIAARLKDREYRLRSAIEIMEQAGVLDAIDEDPATLFSNVRISALPPEDTELLRQTGHSSPDAELVLITEYSRTHLARDRYQERKPSAIIRDAPDAVQRAIDQLAEPEQDNTAKNSVPEEAKDMQWNRENIAGWRTRRRQRFAWNRMHYRAEPRDRCGGDRLWRSGRRFDLPRSR